MADCTKSLLLLLLLLVFLMVTNSTARHHHRNRLKNFIALNRHKSTKTYLEIDGTGNCYSSDLTLAGRCVRRQDCLDMEEKQIQPLSCYNTTYENFVCCPNDGYALSQEIMKHVPQIRKSERACSRNYFGHKHRRITFTNNVDGSSTLRNEYPYMCSLGWRSQHGGHQLVYYCGCVLIAQKYVLTAAHCVNMSGRKSPNVVVLGGVRLYDEHAEIIKIKHIIAHPKYKVNELYNDIAIVKLEKATRKRPTCLWTIDKLPQQQFTALSYGQNQLAENTSSTLLQTYLSVLPNEHCNTLLADKNLLSMGQICAAGELRSCRNNSVGPLLMKLPQGNSYVPYVIGFTSVGADCPLGAPSIYTRISHYIDWIEHTLWQRKNKIHKSN